MSYTILCGDIVLGKRHQQRMLNLSNYVLLGLETEVDYIRFNKAIKVTFVSYNTGPEM